MIDDFGVQIRRMTEIDYGKMLEWRQDEDVKKFYSNPHDSYTLEKVVNKYKARIEGNDKKTPCIIEHNGNPIGYIQYYELEIEEKQKYELPVKIITYGMDILIGSAGYRNKGIATQAIRLLQKQLSEKTNVQNIILKLSKENISAKRCYEKCGFCKLKDINESIMLMEYSYGYQNINHC